MTALESDDASVDGRASDGAAFDGASVRDAAIDASADVVRRDAAPRGPTDMVVTTIEAEIGCARGEWCWESPLPQGEAMFAGFAFAENDQWIFGGAGMALRYDGSRWSRVRTGTRATLTGAWGSGPNDVWAVGYRNDAGGMLVERVLGRWNGVAFSRAPALPAGMTAVFVHGSNASDVWVVANMGTSSNARVLRFDGVRWSEVGAGLPAVNATGIWVESATRVWLTGATTSGATQNGAWRYDGAQWQSVGMIEPLGYRAFRRGPVVFEGVAFALVAATDGNADGLVRIEDGGIRVEPSPSRAIGYESSLTVGGGSLWLVPGNSANNLVHRRRSLASGWTSSSVPTNDTVRAPTVLVSGSASGAWMGNVYADLFRLRDGAGAGAITLESAVNRQRMLRFAGRRSAPAAALTLGDSLLLRDSRTTQWSVGAALVAAPTQVEYLPDATLAFAVTSGRVQRFVNNAPAGALYGASITAVFARAANDAVAVGHRLVDRWDGAQWTSLPAVPAMIATLPTNDVDFDAVWMDAQDLFVAGGVGRAELEFDRYGVLCRYRGAAWGCVAAPGPQGTASNISRLVRGADGALYALLGSASGGGALHRIDRETLAFAEVTFDGERRTWSYLASNESTGELALVDDGVVVVHPVNQQADRYTVPVSGYASHARDVYIGDDRTLWLLRENTEVLRLSP